MRSGQQIRRALLGVSVGVLALQAAVIAPADASGHRSSSWPLSQGNATATRSNPNEKTIGPGNVHRLTPKWLQRKAFGPAWILFGAGRLYTDCSGSVCALNPRNGHVEWVHHGSGLPVGLVGSRLLFTTYGAIGALNPNNGRLLWRQTFAEQDVVPWVTPEPNGLMYVEDYDNQLVAFRESNGAFVWQRDAEGISAAMALHRSRLYASGPGHDITVMNARTGKTEWTGVSDMPSIGRLLVTDGMVIAGGYEGQGHNLVAWRASGCGRAHCPVAWQRAYGKRALVSLAAAGATAFGITDESIGVNDRYKPGTVWAFSARTGHIRWTAPSAYAYGYGEGVPDGQPTVANGVVYVGTADGQIKAYKAAGCGAAHCSSVWRAQIGGTQGQILSPSVAGGRLYVFGAAGLYAFGLRAAGAAKPAVPAAPTHLQTAGTCYSVDVDFYRAVNHTRWPVTEYVTLASDNRHRAYSDPVAGQQGQSSDVTNLTNGKSYTFRVRALTAAGSSPWSAVSPAATPNC